MFSKIIRPLAESCTKIGFAKRIKPVYIWPKLHGRSQSVNVRSYSSVINEYNNVNDRKQFNLVRSSIQKVKVCFILAQVWRDIPAYLSDAIESIQRRALRIIFPNSSYQQALDLTNLSTLANRRILLCKKLMADMRDESHPISFLAPKVTTRNISYQLRSGNTTAPKTMKRTKRANDFFTFRFA